MACTSAMRPVVVRCSRSRARAVSHRSWCAGTMAMRRCSCPAPVCALTPPARRPMENPASTASVHDCPRRRGRAGDTSQCADSVCGRAWRRHAGRPVSGLESSAPRMQIGRRTNAPAHGVGGHPRLVQRDVALGGGAHAELGSIRVAVIPSVVVGATKPPGVIAAPSRHRRVCRLNSGDRGGRAGSVHRLGARADRLSPILHAIVMPGGLTMAEGWSRGPGERPVLRGECSAVRRPSWVPTSGRLAPRCAWA